MTVRFMKGTPYEELERQMQMIPRFTKSMAGQLPFFFFLPNHRDRFESRWNGHGRAADEDAMCAALYLLSADRLLWEKAEGAVLPEMIRFREIRIQGIDLQEYVLYHVAKDLYQGSGQISLSELTDPELVSSQTFRLVLSAFLIRRYGAAVLKENGGKVEVWRDK
mgnify:CR=1 FL=1